MGNYTPQQTSRTAWVYYLNGETALDQYASATALMMGAPELYLKYNSNQGFGNFSETYSTKSTMTPAWVSGEERVMSRKDYLRVSVPSRTEHMSTLRSTGVIGPLTSNWVHHGQPPVLQQDTMRAALLQKVYAPGHFSNLLEHHSCFVFQEQSRKWVVDYPMIQVHATIYEEMMDANALEALYMADSDARLPDIVLKGLPPYSYEGLVDVVLHSELTEATAKTKHKVEAEASSSRSSDSTRRPHTGGAPDLRRSQGGESSGKGSSRTGVDHSQRRHKRA